MYVVLKAQSKQDRSEVPIFLDSSMVEHSAVNRGVVGSSPIRGAIKTAFVLSFFVITPEDKKTPLKH